MQVRLPALVDIGMGWRTRWLAVAAGLLLSVLQPLVDVQAQTPSAGCQRALTDYRVALQSYRDGLFDPAFAGFESYILHCPLGEYVGQAHYLLADMLTAQSKCGKALPHVKEALGQPLAPALRPYVLFLGARCARQLKRAAEARKYLLDIVVTKAPSEIKAPAFYWLGELSFQQKNDDDAKRNYEWALQEAPQGPYAAHAQYSLGFIAQRRGDLPAALRAFDAFLKLAPTHQLADRVRFAQADLLRQNGQLQASMAAFQALAQTLVGGMQEESLFRWAELAYELERYGEAQTAYQQLIKAFPKSQRLPASLYGLGWSAMRQQQCSAATAPWERLVQLPPERTAPGQVRELHYHLGICYLELGDPSRARQHFRPVAETGEDTMEQREAIIKLAALAYQANDFDEAITFYTRALTTAEADRAPHYHFLLGESYQARGESEQAAVHWRQVITGDPDLPFYPQAIDRLGRAAIARRDWEQAIPLLHRLWDEFPDFPQRATVALGLAQAYSQTDQCEVALPFYAFLASSKTYETELQELRHSHAACLFSTARYPEVVALLTPLLGPESTGSMDPVLLYTLGQAHMELAQFEAAITPFTRLQSEFPEHPLIPPMLPRLAYAFEQTGRLDDALTTWQSHVQQGANIDETAQLRLQLHMGRLALQAKRFEDALTLLPETGEMPATDLAAETLFWRAEVYYEQQRWSVAKQQYEALLARDETDRWSEAARLRLGAVYERQNEWDLALETYRRLQETATDAEMIANAERRIAAIEAGLVRQGSQTPQPSATTPKSSAKSKGSEG